jgi:hypothetical protein
VLQLFAQQDPCSCQTHEYSLLFLAYSAFRHPQALHCITLEIDRTAHRTHSKAPIRFDPAFRITKSAPKNCNGYRRRPKSPGRFTILDFSPGNFVVHTSHDWGSGRGVTEQNSRRRPSLGVPSPVRPPNGQRVLFSLTRGGAGGHSGQFAKINHSASARYLATSRLAAASAVFLASRRAPRQQRFRLFCAWRSFPVGARPRSSLAITKLALCFLHAASASASLGRPCARRLEWRQRASYDCGEAFCCARVVSLSLNSLKRCGDSRHSALDEPTQTFAMPRQRERAPRPRSLARCQVRSMARGRPLTSNNK